jgi:hypothetical protein
VDGPSGISARVVVLILVGWDDGELESAAHFSPTLMTVLVWKTLLDISYVLLISDV